MPLPIDLAGDWRLLHADLLRDVYLRAYDPAADAHAAEPGEPCVGVRGPRRKADEGGRVVTRATWTLTDVPEAGVVLRSLIADGTDSWVVQTAEPDPAAGAVWVCECVQE